MKDLISAEKPVFEEERHKYFHPVTGEELTSVTTVYKEYFGQFDAEAVLDEYYAGWQEPTSKRFDDYGGLSREEIIDLWEENRDSAAAHGTFVHDAIESYLLGDIDQIDISEFDDGAAQIKIMLATNWEKQAERLYQPQMVFPEEQLYSDEHRIAGTIDLLFIDGDNNVTLIDWKTNSKDLSKVFYDRAARRVKTAEYPIAELDDCAISKYIMQLSTYAYIIENEWTLDGEPLKIKKLIIPWLTEKGIKEYDIPYRKDLVEKVLNQ